ncbi:MAG: hypothetical protein DMF61_12745 [Blastocatellia bacterium AA13]|nr:MAG: hypothetical protein DMF61_12745 [Blastocatellia bacterium AA13]
MNWEERLLTLTEPEGETSNLISRVSALLDQQKREWPLLAAGYGALARAEIRRFEMDGAPVFVQQNAGRIRSTAASVDKASVDARECFLCSSNLPPEEKGIAYGESHVILCNPYPVLERHLSIVSVRHTEQRIGGNIRLMLELAHDLSPDYFVLYNGPECGASAPDHFHLQACSRSNLPIEAVLATGEPAPEPHCDECEDTVLTYFELFTVSDSGRTVIVIRGGDWTVLARWIENIVNALGSRADKEEPLLNVILNYQKAVWTVFIFPRKKHRPACFYAEGAEKILVSPGAIDMAGILVVPEHDHFLKLDAKRIKEIYSEVSLEEDEVNSVLETLCE